MKTETQWQLKTAETNLRQAQKKLSTEDSHKLQTAIEIIKAVAQKQEIKNG
ncbi:hypothetical protein ORI99_00170 [Alishewanella sp. SMS9]|nr:hypothetical protein [Alishewanella sp. SMS9]